MAAPLLMLKRRQTDLEVVKKAQNPKKSRPNLTKAANIERPIINISWREKEGNQWKKSLQQL